MSLSWVPSLVATAQCAYSGMNKAVHSYLSHSTFQELFVGPKNFLAYLQVL